MASKVAKRKAGKKLKENMWKENEVFLFPTVLSPLEERDKPWAFILETLALKKTANERIFIKILEEFDDVLAKEGKEKDENYRFTVVELKAKYKCLKKDWRRINTLLYCRIVTAPKKKPVFYPSNVNSRRKIFNS